ncbi:MAG: tetratricopeptide repeat protein [Verrucomicrobia bacterium]|nr:tetratricopeptide repeat protein [Verrucomicrobiota bacterium]
MKIHRDFVWIWRRVRACLVALCVAILLAAASRTHGAETEPPSQPSRADAARYFRVGLGVYREISVEKGTQLLTKAHELDKENALYSIYLSDALHATGDRNKANELANEVTKTLREAHMRHFFTAKRALLKDDAETALYEFRESLILQPTAYAFYELAEIEIGRGDLENATLDLDIALKRFPDDYFLNNQRGTVWFMVGKHDEAIASFTAAVRADTSLPFARINRGLAYYELGEYDRALKDYDAVLSVYPDIERARFLKALALERTRKYGAAREIIDALTLAHPDDPGLWLAQGWLDYKTDKVREGEELLIKYVQTKPDDAEGHYKLATLYAGRRKTSDALAKLRRALELDYERTTARLPGDAEWDHYRDTKAFKALLGATSPKQ